MIFSIGIFSGFCTDSFATDDSAAKRPTSLVLLRRQHRYLDAALACNLSRASVAGIDVAGHAHAGVGGQHPFQAHSRFRRAVGDDHLAGVQAVADADAAAVVEADPGRAAGRVDERIEDGPVADGVGAVRMPSVSRLGLATEPLSRWSRPITIGALTFPSATS